MLQHINTELLLHVCYGQNILPANVYMDTLSASWQFNKWALLIIVHFFSLFPLNVFFGDTHYFFFFFLHFVLSRGNLDVRDVVKERTVSATWLYEVGTIDPHHLTSGSNRSHILFIRSCETDWYFLFPCLADENLFFLILNTIFNCLHDLHFFSPLVRATLFAYLP